MLMPSLARPLPMVPNLDTMAPRTGHENLLLRFLATVYELRAGREAALRGAERTVYVRFGVLLAAVAEEPCALPASITFCPTASV